MSDNWFVIWPQDPMAVPSDDAVSRVVERFKVLIDNQVGDVEVIHTESLHVVDCGSNVTEFRCPSCDKEIDRRWFFERLDAVYNGTLNSAWVTSPCCARQINLNHLESDYPIGVARVSIAFMNPSRRFTSEEVAEAADVLRMPVRSTWRHI